MQWWQVAKLWKPCQELGDLEGCRPANGRRLFVVAGPDSQVGQMTSPQPEGDLRDHIRGDHVNYRLLLQWSNV